MSRGIPTGMKMHAYLDDMQSYWAILSDVFGD